MNISQIQSGAEPPARTEEFVSYRMKNMINPMMLNMSNQNHAPRPIYIDKFFYAKKLVITNKMRIE